MTPKCPNCKRDQDDCVCVDEIEYLRAQVAELKAENARLRMALADTEALEIGTAERCKRWRESHMMSQTKVSEFSYNYKLLHSTIK